MEDIQKRVNQRIDAGLFFRDKEEVDFRLPKVIHYCDEDARKLLLSLGFGKGDVVNWDEQLKNRFLISMDGNGATCSRVSISLKSNSVLLKYDSPYILFYFSTLIPWVHYIPIKHHEDVLRVVRNEKSGASNYERIAANSKLFYDTCLNEPVLLRYGAALLEKYSRIFTTD